jgi:hypothetical protein
MLLCVVVCKRGGEVSLICVVWGCIQGVGGEPGTLHTYSFHGSMVEWSHPVTGGACSIPGKFVDRNVNKFVLYSMFFCILRTWLERPLNKNMAIWPYSAATFILSCISALHSCKSIGHILYPLHKGSNLCVWSRTVCILINCFFFLAGHKKYSS